MRKAKVKRAVTEIAAATGYTRRTVQRWLAAGKLKGAGAFRTRGGHWRMRKSGDSRA